MNMEVIRMQLRIIKYSLVVMATVMAVAFFILQKPKPFILGLLFGSLISILNFRSMAVALEKAVKMSGPNASIYAGIMYFVRMSISGVVLYLSMKAPYLNFWGTLLGLLLIKFVIQTENFLNLYRKR